MPLANQVDIKTIGKLTNKRKSILNIDIAYKDEGQGEVIFCLPPWPNGSTAFTPFIHALKNSYRIIALDLPGWAGYSDDMPILPTVENYTLIIEEFILSFGVKEYNLLGYSFGGVFVQTTLERGNVHPKKLVFVSTLHSGNEINNNFHALLNLYKIATKFRLALGIRAYVFERQFRAVKIVGNSYYKKYLRTAFYKQVIKERARAKIDKIFGAMFSLLHSEFIDPIVKKFDSLVIYADADHKFIRTESIEMANYLGCEPVIIPDADHDHFTYEVNKSSQIILDFLQKENGPLQKVKRMFTNL